jgi:hypothetical protein
VLEKRRSKIASCVSLLSQFAWRELRRKKNILTSSTPPRPDTRAVSVVVPVRGRFPRAGMPFRTREVNQVRPQTCKRCRRKYHSESYNNRTYRRPRFKYRGTQGCRDAPHRSHQPPRVFPQTMCASMDTLIPESDLHSVGPAIYSQCVVPPCGESKRVPVNGERL